MAVDSLINEYKAKGMSERDIIQLLDISQNDLGKFRRFAQRRIFKEPLAYIKGNMDFFGRTFKVDRRVYVPNPETEMMVRAFIEETSTGSTILEVGTGCGCIAITLAKEASYSKIYASDLDPNALWVAKENAETHNVRIGFFESNYIDDLKICSPDCIISDMPYGNERYILPSIDVCEFQHMPSLACFHPLGLLESYRELIDSIQRKGWKTKLFFETGRVEKDEVQKIIPPGKKWDYFILDKDYSMVVLVFD